MLWQSENPNTFAKVLYINKGNGTRWFEYVLTTNNGTVRLPNTGPISNIAGRRLHPRDQQRRGDGHRPSGSIDGDDLAPDRQPDHRARRPT